MAVLTANQLQLLRGGRHKQEVWLSAVPKKVLWTARINDPAIVKGEMFINWDSGATDPNFGALGFADVEAFQTVWVGTTAGAYDVGKLRIRDVTSGDGGITGILKAAGHSLDLTDDLFLTFIHMYEILPRWSDINDTTEEFYRDDDISYTAAGEPNNPPWPTLIVGPNLAVFIDDITGQAVVPVNMARSYIMAPNTTIDNFSATVSPTSLATVNINPTTGVGTITFDSVGAYWIKFSITDSNGHVQIGWRAYYIHSNDPNSEHYPITNFQVTNFGGTWDDGGWNMGIELWDDADYDKIPDGTIIMLWGNSYYGSTQENINFFHAEFKHMIFSGYIMSQQIRHDNVSGAHTVVFECSTAQAILKNIYSYSVPLEAVANPAKWNEYPEYLTPGRAARYVMEWHCTVFYLVDVLGLTNSPPYYRKYFEYTEGSIYDILNTLTYDAASREKLICDSVGRFHLVRDLQLQSDAVRAAATKIADFDDKDLGPGPLEVVHNEPTSAVVWTSGFSYDGALGEPEPWYALAPGLKPHRRGGSTGNYERQTFFDEEDSLVVAGRFWSRDNNPYAEVRMNLQGNYMGVFQPHIQEWWEINLTGPDTARALVWTDKKLLCRGVSIEFVYENDAFTGAVRVNVTMEPEAPPARGVPWEYTELPPIDIWDDPTWDTVNGAIMTAGSAWFLPPLQSTWIERTTDVIVDMHEDPYWFSKQSSDDPNDAILWSVGDAFIKRTIDAGGNWTDETPTTDPTNYYGDSPAPTAADLTFKAVVPNYSFNGEFVVGAVWNNGSAWRSWLAVTSDDGATWTWVPVI